jgi:hypothetical protein
MVMFFQFKDESRCDIDHCTSAAWADRTEPFGQNRRRGQGFKMTEPFGHNHQLRRGT